MKIKNTLKQGSVRVLVYQDKKNKKWYATALEFNLTVDATDKTVAFLELEELIKEYIKIVQEMKSVSILNQKVDLELEKIWLNSIDSKKQKPIKSPYNIGFVGTLKNYA